MGVCGQTFERKENVEEKNDTKKTPTKQRKKAQIIIDKNRIDLSPEEIQKIMEENAQKNDEVIELNKKVKEYENLNANLLSENNQLKLACGQYQLMLLNLQNQNPTQNFFNNNMNSWREQINTLVNYNNNFNNNCFPNNMDINNNNNNNFNNNNNNGFFNSFNNNNFNNNNFNNNNNINFNNNFNMNNDINNNFRNSFNNNNFNNNFNGNNNNINNNGNNGEIKTIIFQFENGKRFSTATFESCGLKDVFYLISIQIQDPVFSDVKKLKFIYNTHDITMNFINNDEVRILKLPMSSVIEVNRLRNIIETRINK